MSKYKVGDVAAMFSKPKEPTTEAGKKLQSLFKEYNKKAKVEPHQNIGGNISSAGKGNNEAQREFKKNGKRKFSAVSIPESSFENANKKKFKKISEQIDCKTSEHKEKDKKNFPEMQFPRTQKTPKNKHKKFNNSMPNDFHVNKTVISDSNQESREKFQSKKKMKGKNGVHGFIKKSQQLKKNSVNGIVEKHDEVNMSNDNVFSDTKEESRDTLLPKKKMKNKKKGTSETDPLESESIEKSSKMETFDNEKTLKGEIAEFVKKSAKKLKKQYGNNCFEKSLLNHNDPSNGNEGNEKLSLEVFDNDNTLNREISGLGKKSAKKLKKKHGDNSFEKSSLNLDDSYIENEGNGKNKNEDTESFLSNRDFKTEAKDFIRSAKKLNKKSDSKNFNLKVSNDKEPDFIKLPTSKSEDEEDKLRRTLFVGNLPLNITKKDLKTLFTSFGEIEDIRYHGIETNKAKIFNEDGPKVLTTSNYAADSVPGFIVFKDRQSAIYALSLSGSVFKGHHITVDFAIPAGNKKFYEEKRSIFIGNLPFSCSDESVWDAFSECGRIESVRVVRDKQNGIGKGFGYVQFSTVQAKENALALQNLFIQDRLIRIKAVESNPKATHKTDNNTSSQVKRDSFKSHAIRLKKRNQKPGSRKSVKKIMKKQKTLHNKKKIANILQKSMK